MKRFWEHAQRISWKCHSHSVQTIDFGVVFKATRLLSCQISFSELKQNGFTNLFSYCTAPSEGEAIWGERQGRGGSQTHCTPTQLHPLPACVRTRTHRHPWVYPAGSLLKQTAVLWAVSRSVSGPDEDGARLFFLLRDVMGFYSCLSV